MFEPEPRSPGTQRRRAIILLVVLALLTLFAIVGLTFVLYADAEATSSRIFREAPYPRNGSLPNATLIVDPNVALAQLIYDVPDASFANSGPNVYSAIRGHSLARDMYGYNYTWNPTAQLPNPPLNNIYPFNGTGRLHYASVLGLADDALVPNYTYYSADGFVRDPERYGTRANLTAAPQLYTGGQNSSYTYPDHNHMFLGAMKADGTLLAQSFYRPWIFDPTGMGLNNTANPNWTNAAGKYLLLRPRPQDMDPTFPYPADAGGDVKNVTGAPGGNDSIWMDFDYPVQATSLGQKYKPLFAFHVQDLDNRVNINAHGNVRGQGNTHVSNQGLGPWDVNLGLVLNQNPTEWSNLFVGNVGTVYGRYGPDQLPNQPPGPWGKVAQPGNLAHVYAQIDVDSCNELANNVPTGPVTLPISLPNAFPAFPQGYSNGNTTERTNHPMSYNVVQPAFVQSRPTPIYDRKFAVSNMFQLLYVGQTGSQALSAEPGQLCPTNFGNARICNLVTTDSWDLDCPAVTPWLYNRDASNYLVATTSPADQQPPTGPAVPFPDPATYRNNPLNPTVPTNSDFATPGKPTNDPTVDWRTYYQHTLGQADVNDSPLAAGGVIQQFLSRVDLNRFLTPYPHMGQGTTPLNYQSTPLITTQPIRFDIDQSSNGPIYRQFQFAQADRQQLADDIYRRLLRVTGVAAPANPANPSDTELMPRRWLAQLAVNIVDFIDEDDISTPFNFYTVSDFGPGATAPNIYDISAGNLEMLKYWVFGTELPRVVLNEVLTEYQLPQGGVAGNVNVNFWAELYNPLPPAAPVPLQQLDIQGVALSVAATGSNGPYSPYQVAVGDTILSRGAGFNDNILGTITNKRSQTGPTEFPANVASVDGKSNPASSIVPFDSTKPLGTTGFFLVGSNNPDIGNTISPSSSMTLTVPGSTPLLQSPNMFYTLWYDPAGPSFTYPNQTGTPVMDTTNGVTVLLRRLANPYLPFNQNNNPYITIDYLDGVKLNQVVDKTTAHNSRGRRQPYASALVQIVDQKDPAGGTAATQHSLGQLNKATGTAPNTDLPNYDWLVHLDRQVLSPMELFNVSGFHPWQLTHQFRTDNGSGANPNYGHLVPWTDQTNRLYRIFEFLEAHDRAAGMTAGGRLAGKININTIWDQETFNALCDQQTSNHFTAADVNQVYQSMITLRTPNLGGAPPALSANDQPFLSLGTGYSGGDPLYPGGSGINNTLLRSATAGGAAGTPRLFQAASQLASSNPPVWHPYFQNELMTKIYNNVTTRSNVFAVWLTVGFFNVVQDTDAMGNPVRPVKLGSEMGAQYRHRYFAIIDRTNLNIASPAQYLTTASTPVLPAPPMGSGPSFPVTVTVTPQAMSGTTTNGMSWSIQPGTKLMVDTASVGFSSPTPNPETVIVKSVTQTTFTATFMRQHGNGPPRPMTPWSITIPGNPGPQPTFTPWDPAYQPVIPYFTVIN
jgi:hypothetical protein